jgi:hypothetical protein
MSGSNGSMSLQIRASRFDALLERVRVSNAELAAV